jgi:exosortase A-associated hydrolase 1
MTERGISFACESCWLYGVLSVPEQPAARGVLLVVGGPQYRVGSHRQFTLLARRLAEAGVAVMRFDYRGMGDSEGDRRSFGAVDADLRAAVDAFTAQVPEVREVVLWGLCDAASAALFYAHQDRRVTGLALVNPWARTEEGAARATLKHYYLSRLMQPGLWKKLATGRFDYRAAFQSFLDLCAAAGNRAGAAAHSSGRSAEDVVAASGADDARALPARMLDGFSRFKGRTLFIISGADLTAREFEDMAAAPAWRRLMRDGQVTRRALAGADHTFSRREWREQVADWTLGWLRSW